MISRQLPAAIPSSCQHKDHSRRECVHAACAGIDSESSEMAQLTSTVYSDVPTGDDTSNQYLHLQRIFCIDDLHRTLMCPRFRISCADAKTAPVQIIFLKSFTIFTDVNTLKLSAGIKFCTLYFLCNVYSVLSLTPEKSVFLNYSVNIHFKCKATQNTAKTPLS